MRYKALAASCDNSQSREKLFSFQNSQERRRGQVYILTKANAKDRTEEILERIKYYSISEFAHAFVPTRSIRTHAALHKFSVCFIKIDLQDFFPSILFQSVRNNFISLGFSGALSDQLARLTTLLGSLPQGAPTSPQISNLVMRPLDAALGDFAGAHSLIYSRYSDDIVLSGDRIDLNTYSLACALIEAAGYRINVSKSRLMRNPKKVILTGISISEGQPKVPREFKRGLRKAAFELFHAGNPVAGRDGKVDPFRFDRIMGQLSFWSFIEPDAAFPRRFKELLRERFRQPSLPSSRV